MATTGGMALHLANRAGFYELLPGIMQAHPGEYALIHDARLIGCYGSESGAIDEGYRISGTRRPIYVRKITENEAMTGEPGGSTADGCSEIIIDYGPNGYKAMVHAAIELTPEQAAGKQSAGEPLPSPMPLPWQCLMDTGAQRTHVKMPVVERLRIDPVGATDVDLFDGQVIEDAPVYRVHFSFTSPPGSQPFYTCPGQATDVIAGAAPHIPHDVLLGMDILTRCMMEFDGPGKRFTIKMLPRPE